MKITKEMRDRLFEMWEIQQEHHHVFEDLAPKVIEFEKRAFKAAFDILLPIISKQQEALEAIALEDIIVSENGWENEHFLDVKQAKETLAFVEQEIKKMGSV